MVEFKLGVNGVLFIYIYIQKGGTFVHAYLKVGVRIVNEINKLINSLRRGRHLRSLERLNLSVEVWLFARSQIEIH